MARKKPRQFAGGFLALPHALLHSPAFRSLSYKAVKLLLDIASQFNGKNNGDLCAAWKIMVARGWKSEQTLQVAKNELLQAGMIAETRKGRRPNVCSLYGITWQPLNPSDKFEIEPFAFPVGAWDRVNRPLIIVKRPPKNTSLTTIPEI